MKTTGYPLHSPVSPSLPLPFVTVCLQISTGVYFLTDYKRTSPFKSAGASVQSTTGSRGVRNSGSNAGYTMFRGSVKGTGYPIHSPFSPSFPLPAPPCVIRFQLDSTSNVNAMHFRSNAVASRSQWPRDLMRGSTAARLLVLWVCLLCVLCIVRWRSATRLETYGRVRDMYGDFFAFMITKHVLSHIIIVEPLIISGSRSCSLYKI